jgi:hypothetical protein
MVKPLKATNAGKASTGGKAVRHLARDTGVSNAKAKVIIKKGNKQYIASPKDLNTGTSQAKKIKGQSK